MRELAIGFSAIVLAAAGAGGPSQALGAAQEDTEKRPVSMTEIAADLVESPEYLTAAAPVCGYPTARDSLAPALNQAETRILQSFNETVEAAGYEAVGNSGSLFDTDRQRTDYQVGANIRRLTGNFCAGILSGYTRGRATLEMTVDWEIYSSLRREVVGRLTTTAAAEQNTTVSTMSEVVAAVFKANADRFVTSTEFQEAFTIGPTAASVASAIASGDAITVTNPQSGTPREISDAVGSVVTLVNGSGHGSGFVVSSEGHILTNAHVVGEQTEIVVRWSDGLETVGRVLRKHDLRDVAVLESRVRREPLVLNPGNPRVGVNVSAIGAPLHEDLSGTVTRGIVSANRIIDGYAFIQSDANINGGNSGGPLLDENGAVVGITVASVLTRDYGLPSGINIFIPIQDAIDFLNLDVRQPQTAAATD
jgi:serine protease Do